MLSRYPLNYSQPEQLKSDSVAYTFCICNEDHCQPWPVAVLYMRMMCLSFAPTNHGLGLSKVRFPDYLLGTALGELVSIFVLAFFLGTLKEIWFSGDWGQILSTKVVLSAGLVFVSVWTPKIIDRMKSSLNRPDRRVSGEQ